jgi:hypothetical protein
MLKLINKEIDTALDCSVLNDCQILKNKDYSFHDEIAIQNKMSKSTSKHLFAPILKIISGKLF